MKKLIQNFYSTLNKKQTMQLLIEDGLIKEIGESISTTDVDEVIDAQGHFLAPGFIDVHVHLREPGGEHKETIETGTKAAARGGYTTICSMPNTNPVPSTKESLTRVNDIIKKDAIVKVYPYASITDGLKGETLVDFETLSENGAFQFTDDGVGVQSAKQMLDAMKEAKKVNKAIVAHCEENTLINNGAVHEGSVSKRLGINGIPSICESTQIARDVLLAEATGCHYHVCHVSTEASVRVIRDAKRAGIHVTAEVTPHHLLLNEDDIRKKDTNFKMNPPLRAKTDQEALLAGLLDGTLDFIATDHAPHHITEKDQPIESAPFGIVGLETAFPLLYTELVLKEVITLDQLLNFLASKPATVFNMSQGWLEVGRPADLVLLDLNETYKLDKETFVSKSKNTPFDGWKVTGKIKQTLVNGVSVYQEGLR